MVLSKLLYRSYPVRSGQVSEADCANRRTLPLRRRLYRTLPIGIRDGSATCPWSILIYGGWSLSLDGIRRSSRSLALDDRITLIPIACPLNWSPWIVPLAINPLPINQSFEPLAWKKDRFTLILIDLAPWSNSPDRYCVPPEPYACSLPSALVTLHRAEALARGHTTPYRLVLDPKQDWSSFQQDFT